MTVHSPTSRHSGKIDRLLRRRRRQAALLLVPTIPLLLAGCSVSPNNAYSPSVSVVFPREGAVRDRLVEPVVSFTQRPAAVARTGDGRVFVSFAGAGERAALQVAEVLGDGSLRPYPMASWNSWDGQPGPSALRAYVNARALQVDRQGFLWVLDSGRPAGASQVVLAGPKLFRIDPSDGSIAQLYYFDHLRDLAPHSSLTDLAVDPDAGFAYISDAGRGAIYVVNLRTREGRSVLLGDGSTQAGSEPLSGRDAYGQNAPHVSSLALSPDRQWLYYHARNGRTLYRVPAAVLQDARMGDGDRTGEVQRVADTGGAIDRIQADSRGHLFLTASERGAVLVCRPGGAVETFVAHDQVRWPAALMLGQDGQLYIAGSDGAHHHALMRVSVDRVERAIAARQAADQARQQAAEAALAAEQARQQAQMRLDAAEVRRREARQQAEQVQEAVDLTEQAQAFSQEAARLVTQAAAAKAAAAVEAERAAARASAAAEEATEAAHLAQLAAEEARRRAEVAREKLAVTSQARAEAQRSDALAQAAAKAHQQAVTDLATAETRAAQLLALRQQRLKESAEALAAAEAAETEALLARQGVQRYLDAAHAAEQVALAAAGRLDAAEQGAVGLAGAPGQTQHEATASVPVD